MQECRLVNSTLATFGAVPWAPATTGTIWVTEDYEYRGPDGRVTKRTATVGPSTFEQTWGYDALGNVRFLG